MVNNYFIQRPFLQMLLRLFVYFIILFAAGRIAFYITYSQVSLLVGQVGNIFKSFWMGFRFDTQTITYLLLPIALIGIGVFLFSVFNKNKQTLFTETTSAVWRNFFVVIKIFYAIVATICSALWIVEIFYYTFFKTRFNVLLFGIKADSHVLPTILKTFPVGWVVFLIFILLLFHYWLLSKIIIAPKRITNFSSKKILPLILLIGIYFLGMRGTVTMFPLHEFNAHFCNNSFINEMCKNPLFCLQNAWIDKQRNVVTKNSAGVPQSYGFAHEQEAWRAFLQDTSIVLSGGLQPAQLWDTTAYNAFLVEHKPHVILLQMESMSNAYMGLHSPQCNTLGALAQQLPYCETYRHCTSMRNGTHATLDWLLSKALLTDISTSQYYAHPFSGNISAMYLNAGYNTQFVTGNELGWDNLDRSIVKQHFTNVVGSAELLQQYPNAPMHEYGVQDETMFAYILQTLQKSKKPQFIYGMSISNHSPYNLPPNYKPYPVDVASFSAFGKTAGIEAVKQNFTSHQYAADCLGKFIAAIRKSSLGSNTIIVATGDHNSKAVLAFNGSNVFQLNAVPCIYYIPPAYKPTSIDTSIFTNHTDIVPSLAQISLSQGIYPKWGNSVFANLADSSNHVAINFDDRWLANKAGLVLFGYGKPQFYNWLNSNHTLVKQSDTSITVLQQLIPYANGLFATSILKMQAEMK